MTSPVSKITSSTNISFSEIREQKETSNKIFTDSDMLRAAEKDTNSENIVNKDKEEENAASKQHKIAPHEELNRYVSNPKGLESERDVSIPENLEQIKITHEADQFIEKIQQRRKKVGTFSLDKPEVAHEADQIIEEIKQRRKKVGTF